MSDDPAFRAWVDRARDVGLEAAAGAVGASLKRASHELVGPCPACGGTDRFSINEAKGLWNCRGAEGGNDSISLVMHAGSLEFLAACELLTGEAPPRGESRADPDIARERKEERRDKEIDKAIAVRKRAEWQSNAVTDLWDRRLPFAGSPADVYLRRRGVHLLPEQTENLGFIPSLEYRGYADEDAEDEVSLGYFPAMVAAMRDAEDRIVAVHRTYLSSDAPTKLVPPGDRSRNKAKKAFGRAGGAIIWLGPRRPVVAIAEGIETAGGWYSLGVGPEEVTIAAAYSRGNISGSSTDTIRHPTIKGRTIQNGEPDPAHPGIILPDWVEEAILLGDGDSDRATNFAHLLTGARRQRNAGKAVSLHIAPERNDWADVNLARIDGAAADDLPPIIPLADFEVIAAEVCRPKFKSRFGMLAWEELDAPGPEHEYLIDGMLTIGDKSVIGGPSQSGKSFFAVGAGMAIARGVQFFGRDVVQGLVIYQAGEGARGVKKRLRAYRKHHNIAANERLPFVLLQSKIDLYSPNGDTAALIEEVQAIAELYGTPLRAFFIDTLATATAGADENSGKDMGAVMANVDKIAAALPGTHVAIVHHMNAAGTKLRGHSSIYANTDQVLLISRDEETNIRTAVIDKQKDDEGGVKFRFKLSRVELGINPKNGKEITSCVVKELSVSQQAASEEKPKADKGVRLSSQENIVFRALLKALNEHGENPPTDRQAIPPDAMVVHGSHWNAAFRALDPAGGDSETEEAAVTRAKRAIASAGSKLMQYGVIRRDNPFVWLTGKAVRGFGDVARQSAAPPPTDQDPEWPSDWPSEFPEDPE
ncbi:AAA family ATPase [Rhodopseudomonas palustris]|nr:AAA family ATPase [Rhodopseudomonas palustris]